MKSLIARFNMPEPRRTKTKELGVQNVEMPVSGLMRRAPRSPERASHFRPEKPKANVSEWAVSPTPALPTPARELGSLTGAGSGGRRKPHGCCCGCRCCEPNPLANDCHKESCRAAPSRAPNAHQTLIPLAAPGHPPHRSASYNR